MFGLYHHLCLMNKLIMKKYLLFLSFSFVCCTQSFAQGSNQNKPNILVILADDLGYHDVSYYGTPDIQTPNIDLLCKAGMRLDYFYANSSVCSPTRASLMSGKYPEMVGVPGVIRSTPEVNFGYLNPRALLLPGMLKKMNYNTALVGKWNLGLESPNTPNEKGFDLFHGFLDDMMDDYYSHVRHGSNYMRRNQEVVAPTGHATDVFTDWAVDFIQDQQKETHPFFLYLAYNAPHTPIQPKEEWLEKIRKRQPGITEKRAKLLGLIEHMDDGIGKVISALKKSGKYDNTLIIFMSDNGGKLEDGANNGTLRGGKGGVYEGSLRVPAVFVWKGHIVPESVSAQRAASMDIFPTIGEIVKSNDTKQIDGVSLLPILTGKASSLNPRPLFFSRREGNLQFGGQTIQTLIDDHWKLLQNSPYQPYELYDLSKDPQELNNVIQSEPDRYKKMLDLLILQIKKAGSVPWQKPAEN